MLKVLLAKMVYTLSQDGLIFSVNNLTSSNPWFDATCLQLHLRFGQCIGLAHLKCGYLATN